MISRSILRQSVAGLLTLLIEDIVVFAATQELPGSAAYVSSPSALVGATATPSGERVFLAGREAHLLTAAERRGVSR